MPVPVINVKKVLGLLQYRYIGISEFRSNSASSAEELVITLTSDRKSMTTTNTSIEREQ
jgi:hypothetical protein